MRGIAARCGLSVSGIYHYYTSKQQMLARTLGLTMADRMHRTQAARADGHDPAERFSLLIENPRCSTRTGGNSDSSGQARCAAWTPAIARRSPSCNPGAVLAARLSPAELPLPTASSARRPPWCGQCGQATRMLDYHGDAPRPRPRCEGSAKQVIALHPRQRTTTPPPPSADTP